MTSTVASRSNGIRSVAQALLVRRTDRSSPSTLVNLRRALTAVKGRTPPRASRCPVFGDSEDEGGGPFRATCTARLRRNHACRS
jgi:hypothetical protein